MKKNKSGASNSKLRSFGFGLLAGVILLFAACGGGTSGTGGGFDVKGVLRTSGSAAVASVQIEVESTDGSNELITVVASTDPSGEFFLELPERPQQIVIHFDSAEIRADYQLSQIPTDASNVRLELEYDPDGNVVAELEREYFDENGLPVPDVDDLAETGMPSPAA